VVAIGIAKKAGQLARPFLFFYIVSCLASWRFNYSDDFLGAPGVTAVQIGFLGGIARSRLN